MSDLNVIGIDVTEVSEIPKHKPGRQIIKGETTYMYVRNATNIITSNYFDCYGIDSNGVPIKVARLRNLATMAIAYPIIVGVYHGTVEGVSTVPTDYYCWVAIKGKIRGYTAAAVSTGAKIYTSGTTGTVDDVSTSQDLLPGLVCYTSAGSSTITNFYAHQEIVLNGY